VKTVFLATDTLIFALTVPAAVLIWILALRISRALLCSRVCNVDPAS